MASKTEMPNWDHYVEHVHDSGSIFSIYAVPLRLEKLDLVCGNQDCNAILQPGTKTLTDFGLMSSPTSWLFGSRQLDSSTTVDALFKSGKNWFGFGFVKCPHCKKVVLPIPKNHNVNRFDADEFSPLPLDQFEMCQPKHGGCGGSILFELHEWETVNPWKVLRNAMIHIGIRMVCSKCGVYDSRLYQTKIRADLKNRKWRENYGYREWVEFLAVMCLNRDPKIFIGVKKEETLVPATLENV
jgi:hypothetical protein